ncbi:MAG: PqqD family protein [Acidimicrobiales bacterium]
MTNWCSTTPTADAPIASTGARRRCGRVCGAGLSGDKLVAVLADAFAVDPAAVATDVATMLDVLAGEGLVAGAGLRAPAPAPPPVQGSWLTLPPADEPPGQAPPRTRPPVLALHTGVELATSSAEVSAYLGELLARCGPRPARPSSAGSSWCPSRAGWSCAPATSSCAPPSTGRSPSARS